MEKPAIADGSRELQCVGRLEIARPELVGFLCGTLPVPTDNAFHSFSSALVPSSETVSAPRYRVLPMETDLNRPPLLPNLPEKVLPIASVQSKAAGDMPWGSGHVASNITRKGEALAVSGLVEHGDEIDVIAPADILKQIFKMPYSKGHLSIAVHRIGQTLVMNTGPSIEEGEKLVRRHSNQSKCADQSLLLNFAMHSVRMEACDCPPTHHVTSEEQSNSSVLPGWCESKGGRTESCDYIAKGDPSQFSGHCDNIGRDEGFNSSAKHPKVREDNIFWGRKKNKFNKGHGAVKKVSQIGEKPRNPVRESEKFRRVSNDEFLRVLFWQFHNFRMLLGSDLLLFSNEKYASVSLHLWDVARQVTPLTWLEAWLDNVMASVPELAICYHENGVVRGYELLKTDDIFLLKGISDDGTPAFHPHVVHQNGLSVLRFLQKNCKQDPAAYWLYKSAGEDVIQLFDLSVIRKSSNECDDSCSPLPSLLRHGRSDSLLSLGTLLYRIAHRLSLSMVPNNRTKCATFFKKCLEFLDEPDHLVVRAFAHEQFARLILNCEEELNLLSEAVPVESELTVVDAEESLDLISSASNLIAHEDLSPLDFDGILSKECKNLDDSLSEISVRMNLEANIVTARDSSAPENSEICDPDNLPSIGTDQSFAVCDVPTTSTQLVKTVADPISSKLAAVHHISQAIKSLRWRRQLQSVDADLVDDASKPFGRPPMVKDFSVCACGDVDCIEVCDIWEWLPTSKLDHKLWKLILLLGESYLALGQAYKEDGQLHQTLKVVELACAVYGSMPQHLDDSRFISSMNTSLTSESKFDIKNEKIQMYIGYETKLTSHSDGDCVPSEQLSSTYLFWARAWTLVGDVHVEFYRSKGNATSVQVDRKPSCRKLRMSSEVVKEVRRLKKKLGQYNCNSCSLVNCSCQSDRASSGSSASSSSGDKRPLGHGRRQTKRLQGRSTLSANIEEITVDLKVENSQTSQINYAQQNRDCGLPSELIGDNVGAKLSASTDFNIEVDPRAQKLGPALPTEHKCSKGDVPEAKNGGIFRYLGIPVGGDSEYNLSAPRSCYEEARKALHGVCCGSEELHSVYKKIGWVCNELGRKRLERKKLDIAELAFAAAIDAFRQVSDHTNIILINCNLGHGRRGLAEEMVSKLESLRAHSVFHSAYKQACETAKLEYRESLRYYGAAKAELNAITDANSVSFSLKNEVFTQFANTYLRLGMLLAREDTAVEAYENGAIGHRKARKELGKHDISANEAIREAVSLYESLGDLRKQEAAYAYFQLACYHRDCCLKFLELDHRKSDVAKGESNALQRAKQYASLAERNWQKSIEFYGPNSHSTMYLTILMEISALSMALSNYFNSNASQMLESALSHLLEGHRVSEEPSGTGDPGIQAKFWSQLQALLKKMLTSLKMSKAGATQLPTSSNRSGDVGKLRELYKMSLKSAELGQLHAMHSLWES